jgi:hypothetical protein
MLVPTIAQIHTKGATETSRTLLAKTIATATVIKIIKVILGFASTK